MFVWSPHNEMYELRFPLDGIWLELVSVRPALVRMALDRGRWSLREPKLHVTSFPCPDLFRPRATRIENGNLLELGARNLNIAELLA
jgi:hypothetical protein